MSAVLLFRGVAACFPALLNRVIHTVVFVGHSLVVHMNVWFVGGCEHLPVPYIFSAGRSPQFLSNSPTPTSTLPSTHLNPTTHSHQLLRSGSLVYHPLACPPFCRTYYHSSIVGHRAFDVHRQRDLTSQVAHLHFRIILRSAASSLGRLPDSIPISTPFGHPSCRS